MSRRSWWTTLTPDELRALYARVFDALARRFRRQRAFEIDDVVQHAFVALFRHRESVDPRRDGLYRYLLTAARNAALDRIRTARKREALAPPAAETPPETPFPARAAEVREEAQKIRELFCELDDFDRLVLWSHVVDGRSIQAIARELDVSWHRVADAVDRTIWLFRRRLTDGP